MQNIITGRRLFISFIISNIFYFTMILWSIPKLSEFCGGLAIFDLRPGGYTFEEAKKLLLALGPEGRSFYLNVQLSLDAIYPITFMITYYAGNIWAFRKIGKWYWAGMIGSYCAVLVGVFDLGENFHIYQMLTNFENLDPDLVNRASMFSRTKAGLSTVTLCCFLFGLFYYRQQKRKGRLS